MTDIEEIFLKVAEFRLIIKEGPWFSAVGWSIKFQGREWGSYFLVESPINKQLIEEATKVFKEAALETLLRLIGRRI